MITQENKQLLFELLYRYYILHEDLVSIDEFIVTLRKEMTVVEAADLKVLDPAELPSQLKSEWQNYVNYRKKQQS